MQNTAAWRPNRRNCCISPPCWPTPSHKRSATISTGSTFTPGSWRRSSPPCRRLPRELPHVGLELVVLVLDRIEKQALQKISAALGVVHLLDQMIDLLDHVLERTLQLFPGRHLAIEHFHDRQQVAVEGNLGAGRGLEGAHVSG